MMTRLLCLVGLHRWGLWVNGKEQAGRCCCDCDAYQVKPMKIREVGMNIQCPLCNLNTPVPEAYNAKDFEGQMRCKRCGAFLEIELLDGECVRSRVFTDYISVMGE